MTRRGAGWLGCVLLALVGMRTAASCSSKSDDGSLGASCAVSGLCESAFLCVFGLCHATCTGAGECEPGYGCILLGSPSVGVCQLPVEKSCTILDASTSCAFGLVCDGREGCRAPCETIDTAPTCFGAQQCGVAAGTTLEACLDPSELEGGAPDTVGQPHDGGARDVRPKDAGLRDASSRDGGPLDSGLRDAGPPDAPPGDTGPHDGARYDSVAPDTGARDGALRDGALRDGALDSTLVADAARDAL